jgi:hypothetical protein
VSARILAIADALVTDLNGMTWVVPFTSYRTYVPINDIKDLGANLDVPIVPSSYANTVLTRSARAQEDHTIDVGIQQRLAESVVTIADITAACDPLTQLVQDIGDRYRGGPAPGDPLATCISSTVTLLFIPKILDEQKVFRSILSLVFRRGF